MSVNRGIYLYHYKVMIKFHLSMMGKLIHSHILLNRSKFNSNNLVEISLINSIKYELN